MKVEPIVHVIRLKECCLTPIFTVNYNRNLLHSGFKSCKKVKKHFITIIPLGVIMMVIMIVGVLCVCVRVCVFSRHEIVWTG